MKHEENFLWSVLVVKIMKYFVCNSNLPSGRRSDIQLCWGFLTNVFAKNSLNIIELVLKDDSVRKEPVLE